MIEMFGNRLGWIIAVILGGLILAPVAWVIQQSRMSAPSGIGLDPANFDPIALPVNPDAAWPLISDDSDAAPFYAKAITAWNDDEQTAAQQFQQSPQGPLPGALRSLLDARHMRTMRLFSQTPTELINYDNDHPRLAKLFTAGESIYRCGLALIQHGNTPDGTACLEAAFSLGRQLAGERITFDEFQKGMELMADSATAMCQGLEHGSPRWTSLQDFVQKLNDYQDQRVVPITQVIFSVDQDVISRTAGDLAALARDSRERMWRVESTLTLGRYRYDAGRPGDQLGAVRLLHQLATDADPNVAIAAQAALGLTDETYRMIH